MSAPLKIEDVERHMLEITLRMQGLSLVCYERLVELRRKHLESGCKCATPAPEAAE